MRMGAFLVGLEGVALLRAAVEQGFDPAFESARFAEITDIIASAGAPPFDEVPVVVPIDTVTGYSRWAPSYDDWNPLIEVEQPAVRRVLGTIEAGDALDAATGTGRHAAFLAARGHRVTGVDSSDAMLAIARAKVPDADFRLGELTSLPLEDGSVDLVVCGLALTHQPALEPVLSEFARVLRPGGHLVTSDIHWLSLYLGGVAGTPDAQGRWGRMPASRFLPSDYLRAGLATGYAPLACEEVLWPDVAGGHGGPLAQTWCPEAVRAAYVGLPAVIMWHLSAPT